MVKQVCIRAVLLAWVMLAHSQSLKGIKEWDFTHRDLPANSENRHAKKASHINGPK